MAGLKVDKCTESETQDEAGSQWKEKRKRNMEEKLNARLFRRSQSECVLNTAFVFMFVLPVRGLDRAPGYITCGVCVQVF